MLYIVNLCIYVTFIATFVVYEEKWLVKAFIFLIRCCDDAAGEN